MMQILFHPPQNYCMNKNSAFENRKLSISAKLNPQASQDPYDISFIIPSASRMKQKVKKTSSSTKRKRKLSSTSLSETMSSTSSLTVNTSIRMMVHERHKLEESSQKIKNVFGYLSTKYQEKLKRKEIQESKNDKISTIINENRSYKKFVSKTISLENKSLIDQKMGMKSLILEHREKKLLSLQKSMLERSIIGEIGRKQVEQSHREIEESKNQKMMLKKEAVARGKEMEEEMRRERERREEEKKKRAEENFRMKWMQEFMRKQKAERENRLRNKVYSKKIAVLLEKTAQLDKKGERDFSEFPQEKLV